MTKTVTSRIGKLEHRFGIARGKPGIVMVVSAAAWRHALDVETCMKILRECGLVPTGPGIGLVNLLHLPEGLNAVELERFLREHGAELRGLDNLVKRDGELARTRPNEASSTATEESRSGAHRSGGANTVHAKVA
jgi:hypothetical protein